MVSRPVIISVGVPHFQMMATRWWLLADTATMAEMHRATHESTTRMAPHGNLALSSRWRCGMKIINGRAATISGDGMTLAIGATRPTHATAVDAGHVQVYRLQPLVSTATDTVRVEITPLNDAPTLDVLMNLNVSEDAAEQVMWPSGISAGGGESQSIRVTAINVYRSYSKSFNLLRIPQCLRESCLHACC